MSFQILGALQTETRIQVLAKKDTLTKPLISTYQDGLGQVREGFTPSRNRLERPGIALQRRFAGRMSKRELDISSRLRYHSGDGHGRRFCP